MWLLQGLKVLPLFHPARKKGLLFLFPCLTLDRDAGGEPGQALALLSSAPAAGRQARGPAAAMASPGTTFEACHSGWHLDLPSGLS